MATRNFKINMSAKDNNNHKHKIITSPSRILRYNLN